MKALRILFLAGLVFTIATGQAQAQKKRAARTRFVPPVIVAQPEESGWDGGLHPPMETSGDFRIDRSSNARSPTAIPVHYELRGDQPLLEWSDSLYVLLRPARPAVVGIRLLYKDTVERSWTPAQPATRHEHAFDLSRLPYERIYRLQFLAAWGEVMEELTLRRSAPNVQAGE